MDKKGEEEKGGERENKIYRLVSLRQGDCNNLDQENPCLVNGEQVKRHRDGDASWYHSNLRPPLGSRNRYQEMMTRISRKKGGGKEAGA